MAYALLQTVVTHPKQLGTSSYFRYCVSKLANATEMKVFICFFISSNCFRVLIFFCNGSQPWKCLLYTNSILFVLTQSVSFVKMYCILILFFKKMYWEKSIVCSAWKKIMNVCMCTVDLFVYYVNRKQIFVLYV